MDVELRIEVVGAQGGSVVVPDAWIYVRQGSAITVGHTDAFGRVRALKANKNASHPWEYTETFVLAVGAQVDFYHSAGKAPIANAVLSEQALSTAFEPITVPSPAPQTVQVGGTGTNTLAIAPLAKITLTPHVLQLTSPRELDIVPVTFTSFSPTYQTDSLRQGNQAFPAPPAPPFPPLSPTSPGLTETEDAVARPPTAAVRPRERAPRISGTVDAAATRVRIRVLDAQGNALQLRANGNSTTNVTEVPATLLPAGSGNRGFQVDLLFADPPRSFGSVQVLAIVDGLPKPTLEAASYLLLGIEAALVDDAETNLDGSQLGPIRDEADDKIVIDFLVSPQGAATVQPLNAAEQAARAAQLVGKNATQQATINRAWTRYQSDKAKASNRGDLGAQTRVRRMVCHDIRFRPRPLPSAPTTQVQTPEMPMWMGELHLAGLSRALCEEWLQRRKHALPPTPPPAAGTAPPPAAPLLTLSFNWALAMNWDAPNSAATTRPFTYNQTFNASVSIALDLDNADVLKGVTNNVATQAFGANAPTALQFPVTTRRAPQVRFDDQRPWGRLAGAQAIITTSVEFQPPITVNNDEVIRGGDAALAIQQLQLDNVAYRPGNDPQGTAFVAPANLDIKVPTVRLLGTTPNAAAVNALIDALVAEFITANPTAARLGLLTLARWQNTVRLIINHESIGMQHFETRGAARRTFGLVAFGHEQHQPLFGAPAGFGLGQLDNPPVSRDQMFDFLEGLRASVDLIMDAKARVAFNLVSPHTTTIAAATISAVFQRQMVRAYNGFSELRFRNGAFELFPTTSADRLQYCNSVLGTTVQYNGVNVAAPFTAADFGP
ncbi:MAG: hypothetical protein EOO73_18745 [Myxococcales bacterium]|nr:MAG: hypothetical protein EOO73_18745 [Myxococcales bacterium]